MRIAIVNDLRLATETLKAIVTSRKDLEVAWTAVDGREAVERCRNDRPDLILMDMVMPVMDGVEATRRIMRESPCPILVVTATVEGNAARVYEALGHGAVDAVQTPTVGLGGAMTGGAELLRKIDHVRLLRGARDPAPKPPMPPPPPLSVGAAPMLAIGASTGGPQAIAQVLGSLPKPFAAPIAVVQHLGAEFVPGFAQWLSEQTTFPSKLVDRGEPLRAGTIHMTARETHLVVHRDGRIGTQDDPRDHLHRPSVDVLFESLARSGIVGVAVLLTGMGRDGAEGLLSLRKSGWWTIAQDRETSTVWGMPGEAVRLSAARATLPLDAIGRAVGAAFASQAWKVPDRSEKR
ncbi:MAG: chemotaxis-specific protein-glutamate methyltransferase CheB [Phycisphaerales bacterium]